MAPLFRFKLNFVGSIPDLGAALAAMNIVAVVVETIERGS